jgi:hypothetical protein
MFLVFASCDTTEPSLTPTPPAGPDTTSHAISWYSQSIGGISSSVLGVWGPSPASVYAVGYIVPDFQGQVISILHHNGNGWGAIENDSLRRWIGGGPLVGVHGTSDSLVVVVGSQGSWMPSTGVAFMWNGKQWTNISPDSCPPLLGVYVVSGSNIYACGANGTLFHYDGTDWQQLESGTTLNIWSLAKIGLEDIYAVGSNNSNSYFGSVILRIRGTAVELDHTFSLGYKLSIWGTKEGEGYVCGEWVARRARNSNWQAWDVPDSGVVLHSVAGTDTNNLIFGGAYGAVVHWSGKSWMFYNQLLDLNTPTSYYAAYAIENKYFLVGRSSGRGLITIGTRM